MIPTEYVMAFELNFEQEALRIQMGTCTNSRR